MEEHPQIASSSSHPPPSSSLRSPDDSLKQPQAPVLSGFSSFPNGDFQMFPIMYPALLNLPQNQEHANRGAGIYAVPVCPTAGPVAGFMTNTLIPLSYNIPTRASTDGGATGEAHVEEGQQQPQQQQQLQNRQHQQPGPQRQVVVRRFQIAVQLDLFLILKLAAVIFLFNQEGSRQRLVVLVFFASLVYLYQTGALTPLIRWLSQGMNRPAVPPNQPRAARQGVEDAAVPEARANENRAAENGDAAAENANLADAEEGIGGNRWWAIVKEIQLIVFGFITSLLPGIHNID